MTKLPIKLVVSAIGVTLLLASPAEAAKRKVYNTATQKQYVRAVDAQPAHAQSVYYGSKYLGSDPDPRIRHELLRDLGAAFGGDN